MKTCLLMAAEAALTSRRRARETRASGQHELLQEICAVRIDRLPLQQLDVLRRMRNAVIHDGGRVDQGLVDAIADMDDEARAAWSGITGTDPSRLASGDRLRLGHGEMLLALAVTKNVDRACNEILQRGIPRSHWARIVVDDALRDHPNAVRAGIALRKCHGFARHYYGALQLTRQEVGDELAARPR